ncbi:hypothetical protein BT69DRAFT_1348841 [Atractiella rhizophila]|nr:hypothetical protein BT69DRAFT_1348841 [Atractiella rhizophila]
MRRLPSLQHVIPLRYPLRRSFPRHFSYTPPTLLARTPPRQQFKWGGNDGKRWEDTKSGTLRPSFRLGRWRLRPGRTVTVLVLLFVITEAYIYRHSEKVELTGRMRLMTVKPEEEEELGREMSKLVLSQNEANILPSTHPVTLKVQKIVDRIVQVIDTLDHGVPTTGGREQWETFVIEDKESNAFTIPGGKIFVYTGLFKDVKNEDELAVVLAHEIAHQVARHPAEKMSTAKLLATLGFVLVFLLGFDPFITTFGLEMLKALPNSREQEIEADSIGMRLLSKACFDPTATIDFWSRMGEKQHVHGILEAFSTHPSHEDRMAHAKEWLPTALEIQSENCTIPKGEVTRFKKMTGLPVEREGEKWSNDEGRKRRPPPPQSGGGGGDVLVDPY